MKTKKEILWKLQRERSFLPVDQEITKTIIFEARGCDISTPNYKGDIYNHRITSLIKINGVNVVIEATATRTKRTHHLTTGEQLKHEKVFYDDNGLHIDFSVEDFPQFEKSFFFGYRSFPCSFHAGSRWVYDVSEFKGSAHTKKRLLSSINAELKTHFENIIIINNSNDEYLTTSEALADPYIKKFDGFNLSDEEYETLKARAADRWLMLQKLGIVSQNENFENESCWITSGDLHGFYFPNSRSGINAIVFGVYGRVVCVLNDEE